MSNLGKSELEIKLAFLERHVEEQDRVILALRNELSALRREVAQLDERLSSADSSEDSSPADERPPHY